MVKKIDLRMTETKEAIISIGNALRECPLNNRALALLIKDARKDLSITQIEAVLTSIPALEKRYLKTAKKK